ncbi:hypothetical protein [Phytoactinopolyspora limicola]|uniref:hypothetical protein n=1 Tax=Phytoactinopolyspora limicola TaxID=2715536 RepID=UPI001408A152|nr:hypothetical protein [Phytoactinopolyspora limicola]
MASRLAEVEVRLREIHAADDTIEPFEKWCGFHEPHRGYRRGGGHHGTGRAIDFNYDTNPYIVTRTGQTLGGEAAAHDQPEMRQRAIEVCDRAVRLAFTSSDRADLSIRVNDSIETTYNRFATVSNCLVDYFAYIFSDHLTTIRRPPIPRVHTLFDGDPAFQQIRANEISVDKDHAVFQFETLFSDPHWQEAHPGWMSAEEQYWQMLRDYEMVRIPMLRGDPRRPITETRNPARGFLDLRGEVVCELVRTGRMRWGASDFGARASGDIMHFDLG